MNRNARTSRPVEALLDNIQKIQGSFEQKLFDDGYLSKNSQFVDLQDDEGGPLPHETRSKSLAFLAKLFRPLVHDSQLLNVSPSIRKEVLLDGIAGDRRSQAIFDNGRRLYLSDFPVEIRKAVVDIARKHYQGLPQEERNPFLKTSSARNRSHLGRKKRQYSDRLNRENGMLPFRPESLDWWALEDFESANEAYLVAKQAKERRRAELVLLKQKNGGKETTNPLDLDSRGPSFSLYISYTPYNPLPMGKAAQSAFEDITVLLHKARVLYDFLDARELKLLPQTDLKLLSSYDEPWEVLRSSKVSRVVQLLESITEKHPSLSAESRSYLVDLFALTSSPEERCDNWISDRKRQLRSQLYPSDSPATRYSSSTTPSEVDPWLNLEISLAKWQQTPKSASALKERMHIIRLCQRRSFSVEKSERLLKRHGGLDGFYKFLMEQRKEQLTRREAKTRGIEEHHESSSASPITDSFPDQTFHYSKVMHYLGSGGKDSVANQLAELDGNPKKKVLQMLSKAEANKLGKPKNLKVSGVNEMKDPSHGGLRIYYAILSQYDSLVILQLGNKSTQVDDAAKAEGKLRTLKKAIKEKPDNFYDLVESQETEPSS